MWNETTIDIFPRTERSVINPVCCDGTTEAETDSLSPAVSCCSATLLLLLLRLHLVSTALIEGAPVSRKNKSGKLEWCRNRTASRGSKRGSSTFFTSLFLSLNVVKIKINLKNKTTTTINS